MKKLILTISAMALATGAFAQGYVSIGNGTGLLEDTNSILSPFFGGPGNGLQGSATGATSVSATPLYYTALFTEAYSGSLTTDTNVFDGTWTFTGLQTQNAPNGQPGKITAVSDVQVNNWGISSTQQFILAAWSANLGATWGVVSNLLATGNFSSVVGTPFFGVSAVNFAAAAAPPTAAASVLWSTAGAQTYGNPIASGIALYEVVVPEPTTLALMGLGGLGLTLIRRQRKS